MDAELIIGDGIRVSSVHPGEPASTRCQRSGHLEPLGKFLHELLVSLVTREPQQLDQNWDLCDMLGPINRIDALELIRKAVVPIIGSVLPFLDHDANLCDHCASDLRQVAPEMFVDIESCSHAWFQWSSPKGGVRH